MGNVGAVEECDRVAAHPFDSQKPANIKGVPFSELKANATIAIRACSEAAKRAPENARMAFLLARSYDASGDKAQAYRWMEKAALAQHVIAKYILADMLRNRNYTKPDFDRAKRLFSEFNFDVEYTSIHPDIVKNSEKIYATPLPSS
ncbi:hypothetical protein ACI7BZ_01040 [Xanthobacter sp. AM11]|uniref:hypothetical protein n=1 Tax=Xanthobacter sp. AM11 TaxID=3380643 RepID=UPI0039BFF0B3